VVGLALSWHLLRRSLALQEVQGTAALATVISTRPTVRGAGPLRVCQQVLNSHASRRAERGMPQESHPVIPEWAAKLSQPSVELLVDDDHVAIEPDGEVIASGLLSR
jgi:hypothetical protein